LADLLKIISQSGSIKNKNSERTENNRRQRERKKNQTANKWRTFLDEHKYQEQSWSSDYNLPL